MTERPESDVPRGVADVVSLFADRRGGPGNFAGSGYQIKTMIRLALEWLQEVSVAPLPSGTLCCEPRHLVEAGQVGFDVGLRGAGRRDELIEVKLKPTKAEVVAVVASTRLVAMTANTPASVRLIGGTRTTAFTSLHRLWSFSREAHDAAHFERLVRESRDALVLELFGELGADALGAARSLEEPTACSVHETDRRIAWTAKAMSADGGVGLVDRLFRLFHEGSGQRLSVDMTGLVDELMTAGLLVEAARVDTSGMPSELIAALVVLQECPVPLPATVLAGALEMPVGELSALLAEHVAGGYLVESGELYWSPAKPLRLALSHGAQALVRVLDRLNCEADRQRAGFAEQVPNALALAKLVMAYDLPVVAFCFKAFDKAAKAWGDLTATHDLANLSNAALVRLLSSDLSSDDQRRYASWRAQTFICGQGWVYQRVDRLEDAARFMRRAKQITEQFDDRENLAFALKCEGRLLRMQAEVLNHDAPEREELLASSARLLRKARPAFEEIRHRDVSEDRGESVSLLARTVATQGDLTTAREIAAEARELLGQVSRSKAMADLILLEAEIDAAARPNDPVGVLDAHRERLLDLLDRHSVREGDPVDRSRSEVTARVRSTLAALYDAAGDGSSADGLYLQASEQYEKLGYDGRRDDARWKARLARGVQLPDQILLAMESMSASSGARLRVMERFDERYAGQGEPGSGEASPPVLDEFLVDSMVRDAIAADAAAAAVWGESPTSA